jgi:hypothetical protein
VLDPKNMSDDQLIEQIKIDQHYEIWKCLVELCHRKIEKNRDNLERAQEQEAVIRLQANIKTLRSVLTIDMK